mmetsp:Transcript_11009/g.16950  ORF Transcript_11009/g.16950 Transcript_11009/m.16950 type:complete len:216 (+) Transcript_11009:1290-1937(+)
MNSALVLSSARTSSCSRLVSAKTDVSAVKTPTVQQSVRRLDGFAVKTFTAPHAFFRRTIKPRSIEKRSSGLAIAARRSAKLLGGSFILCFTTFSARSASMLRTGSVIGDFGTKLPLCESEERSLTLSATCVERLVDIPETTLILSLGMARERKALTEPVLPTGESTKPFFPDDTLSPASSSIEPDVATDTPSPHTDPPAGPRGVKRAKTAAVAFS